MLDKKRIIMATIKADNDLYLYAQPWQFLGKYYMIFASTVDTINTNVGRAGFYPIVFKRYFVPMKDKGM